ncbi:PREDICTED: E2F transcription factor-like E2FE isoform X2 [Fragaria vesca subsp. vesca]|uniref:E2F transcription factor-like E2FE isoform X2 n=1 Tax=Fragaria vesca subsp. vesca TaxID=101020 RepID=UPI0002C32512|nr:PREDICTED: E2F transcription factor-like E2FE isoform X2 [Fragaria vesca subsp. vesca]
MDPAAPPPPPPPTQPETTSTRHHSYSRKQKSLGLLCSNFISLYDREGVTSVGLDDAASKLGVERRRIYDIVNVLESVGVLARKAKNQYSWKGFGAIPDTLQELKEAGLKENFNTFHGNFQGSDDPKCSQGSDDEEGDESGPATGSQNENPGANPKSSANSKNDNRREKSLALLTQNFVKLFVCSTVESISLDEAAKLLLGDVHNASIMRTKVRRIYDIANVLSSMNLIEKTHTADTRKPAYKWLGLRGKDAASSASDESRKRAFGTDITNVSSKRGKGESSTTGKLEAQIQKQHESTVRQRESIVRTVDKNNSEDSREGTKSYQFGPFAPVTIARAGNFNMKKVDWDNFSSTYRPQYQNQAVKELFSHYMEAWKSWYSEVVEKPIQA